MKNVLTIIACAFCINAGACELTSEYLALRVEAAKEIRQLYRQCKKAADAHFFYKAVAECIKEGKGKKVAGGCFHVVGYEETHSSADIEHCELLKPSSDQFIAYLHQVSQQKGVKKCIH